MLRKYIITTALFGSLVSSNLLAEGMADNDYEDSSSYFKFEYGGGMKRRPHFSSTIDTGITYADKNKKNIYSGGFGYNASPHLRIDGTVTFMDKYNVNAGYYGTYAQADGVSRFSTITGTVSSASFLLNAYYDVVKLNVFTPYVGAGAGIAYNKVTDVIINTASNSTTTDIKGSRKAALAFQASGGTAIDLMTGLKADVGYKYYSMGNVQTSRRYSVNNVAGTTTLGGAVKIKKLSAQEYTIGMRYNF